MRKIYKLMILMGFMMIAMAIHSQDSCEDPNAFSTNTFCGTEFDLCFDRYIMDDHQAIELEVFTNDMGMFDPCASYIAGQCSHGTLEKLPNCNYVYTPDEGFIGNDTFYYAMVVNDSCTNEIYCEEDDGKIWSVKSRYKGPDGLNVVVNSKLGNQIEYVGKTNNLQDGDYFTMNGSHLSKSQANWTYTFYAPNGVNGCETDSCFFEDIIVHTSCSEQIMGKDFGLFRVIAGCIATPPNKTDCSSSTRNETYNITTQWTDTTMVVITVYQSLPIEMSELMVSNVNGINRISWEIYSILYEDYIEVEKSTDGKNFTPFHKIYQIETKEYYVDDIECSGSEVNFYRLKIVGLDGKLQYSNVVHIKNDIIKRLRIYPNPTDGNLIIEHNGDEEFAYEIIDLAGKTKYKDDTYSNASAIIPFSTLGLKTGTYIVKIDFGMGDVHFEKIIFISQ